MHNKTATATWHNTATIATSLKKCKLTSSNKQLVSMKKN